MRRNYAAIAPEATKALAGVNAALLRAGLDKRLMDVLFLRVSQINACSYCVDEHARDLRRGTGGPQRLPAPSLSGPTIPLRMPRAHPAPPAGLLDSLCRHAGP